LPTTGSNLVTDTYGGNLCFSGNLDVNGGSIKLDGNYPVGTNNVALGNEALDDGSLTGGLNTAIGSGAMTFLPVAKNVAVGTSSLLITLPAVKTPPLADLRCGLMFPVVTT
jgi:hypothetical protein